MLVITQLPCCIFIKYLQCYFSFILKYAIFFWGLKYFTVLSLKLLISSLDPYFLKEAIFFCMVEPQGGGGTLIFSHIRTLGLFFWFKILNFNIFGVFRKMNIFLDMKILRIFFGGSSQNWASFRVISMHFRVFLKVKGTELGYFFGLLKFQIFFGMFDIPDIFWG